MELFMRNISFSASDTDIKTSFAPILHKPPFTVDSPISFHVRTFKAASGGRCGILTLPTPELGELFLRYHGTRGIFVKDQHILFTLGRKPLERSLLDLNLSTHDPRSLQKEIELARESTPIHLQTFCLGRFCRDGSFSMEVRPPAGESEITCDLLQRRMRLAVALPELESVDDPSPYQLLLMDIGYHPIIMSASYTPTKVIALVQSQETADITRLFIHSNSPPTFIQHGTPLPNSTDERHYSLWIEGNVPVSGCYSMCLTFKNRDDLETFVRRCYKLGLRRVYKRKIILKEGVYSHDKMSKLDKFLGSLEFGLAFQIKKAISSSILTPSEVLLLHANLSVLQRDFGSKAPQVFDVFSTLLQKQRGPSVALSLSQHMDEAIKVFVSEQNRPRNRFAPSPESAVYYSYHLILTPSTSILEGPLPDQSNSVLRRFGHHEYFLRVSFHDDDRSTLRREAGISVTELLKSRFRPYLVDGLSLVGRHYEFLGYSMSGLRNHSVWFMTPFMDEETGVKMDAFHIRNKLGDFSRLAYQPARLGARWSQAFSGTDPSVTLEIHEIRKINDRVSPTGKVMTDGCGTISVALCEEVWSSLRNRKKHKGVRNVPSAYQFRLGGAKGVLVQDPRLKGNLVCLRPSQTKFDASDIRTLDIQSTSSRPKAMFLNRPLIVLLEYLGTDSGHIISLQNDAISEAQAVHHSFLDASKMFQQNGFGASFRLPSLFRNLATLLDLRIGDSSQGSEFHTWDSNLVAQSLHCASTYALRELKYRAHIAVPGSYTLLGVSDEWGCLREGEIYATVQDERTSLYKPIEGPVLITRSPQIHPGDVQLVTAVRRPELSHLTNVVVFSCKGNRSLASCLGGGDLDGDDFNLILDEALFPKKVDVPGDYKSLPIKKTRRPCELSDVADFVIDYIESDLVGYISILHLRFADVKNPGCDECLELAQDASYAVDFPKTGSPVQMKDLPQLSGLSRPDFLAREGANLQSDQYYISQKLLGVLHRRVPMSGWTLTPWDSKYSPSNWDTILEALKRLKPHQLGLPRLTVPSDDLIKEMMFLLKDYSEQLFIIAKAHTISRHKDSYVSEAELISGTIMANWSDHRKRREAVIAMNLQTQMLAKNVRQALQWNDPESYYDDEELYEEDDYEESENDGIATERNESFRRAWAAWIVSEKILFQSPRSSGPKNFGSQSFGLIALARMLDIIKEAQQQ